MERKNTNTNPKGKLENTQQKRERIMEAMEELRGEMAGLLNRNLLPTKTILKGWELTLRQARGLRENTQQEFQFVYVKRIKENVRNSEWNTYTQSFQCVKCERNKDDSRDDCECDRSEPLKWVEILENEN